MPRAWASCSSRAKAGGSSSTEISAGCRNVPSGCGSQAASWAATPIADRTVSRLASANDISTESSTTPAISGRFGLSRLFHTYSARAWPGCRSANSRPSSWAAGSKPSRPRSFRPKSTATVTCPVGPGGAGGQPDVLPHPHVAQLDQPRPVGVTGEPDVRVALEVGLQLLAPLVQPGWRQQARFAAGRVLPDQERGLGEPFQQPLPVGPRSLVQGPGHVLQVGAVPGRVQIGQVQVVIAGQHAVQDRGQQVRLAQAQRDQEPVGGRVRGNGPPDRGGSRVRGCC